MCGFEGIIERGNVYYLFFFCSIHGIIVTIEAYFRRFGDGH